MKKHQIILLFWLFSINGLCQTKMSTDEKNRLFLEGIQQKEKAESEKRKNELAIACEKGVVSIVAFANKYPNTPEAVQAIRVLKKYNSENDVISNKIEVTEEYIWTAEGDRGWLNDVFEENRNTVSGGKQYNIFGFATLMNKTDMAIKLKAVVNLNMTKISNLSIIYNANNYSLTENYYIELLPKQSKSILVLFKNLSEGISIGRLKDDHTLGGSLFSIGSENNINSNKPISVDLYQIESLPPHAKERQNRLIAEVLKNKGNIKVNNVSQSELFNKSLSKCLGANSDNIADLRIYFPKKSSIQEKLTIYDKAGRLIQTDTFNSSGQKSSSYTLDANKAYTVYVPSCNNPYTVFLKKGITHLIIDKECGFRIDHEDEQ